MSNYPWGYPDQRLVVGGIDLTTEFQMILIDGFELNPPEPKFYMIDIPGGNGMIDLTEALGGDVSYKNREQQFVFKAIYPAQWEIVKTLVSNFLHGKYFEYQLSWDPGYTYKGRFQIVSYSHMAKARGKLGEIVIKVTADPYKYKPSPVIYANGIGGEKVICVSGRKPVRPIIQTARSTTVTWKNKTFKVGKGTFRLNDVLFQEGVNELYFNTFTITDTKWEDLGAGGSNQMTWKEAMKYTWDEIQRIKLDIVSPGASTISLLANNDDTVGVSITAFAKAYTWNDLYNADYNWNYLLSNGWTWDGMNTDDTVEGGLFGDDFESGGSAVYITYEWGDL